MFDSKDVIPTTIGGIKGLARNIKKKQNISLNQARLLASKFAGYSNYEHARKVIESRTPSTSKQFKIYITAYWVEEKAIARGRETLSITISQNLREMITPYLKSLSRGLYRFKFVGSDHLVSKFPVDAQFRAREIVCYAARHLQFIDATKLKPWWGFDVFPEGNSRNALPSNDHSSIWRDVQGRLMFMDEPYSMSLDNPKRLAWASKFNQRLELSPWPSMYHPPSAQMFLVSDNETGVPLDPIIKILEKLPKPFMEENWSGESAPYSPRFQSPGQLEKASKLKSSDFKPKTITPRRKRNTLSYGSIYVGYRQMPDGKMPIEDHVEIGQIILRILSNSRYRPGVTNRLEAVRSDLETWGFRDHRSPDSPGYDFIAIYYENIEESHPRKLDKETSIKYLKDLDIVKSKLIKSYPDCKPLRKMLSNIDYAMTSLKEWGN